MEDVTPTPTEIPQQSSTETLISIEEFKKVQLRVARVVSAEAVPKSKKLLRLQVDLGEKLGKRQILSGISQFYTPESLVGRNIIIVANLQPATMMGEQSQGMLLATSTPDMATLCLLDPGQEMPPGTEVR